MTFAGYGIDRIHDASESISRSRRRALSAVVVLVFSGGLAIAIAGQRWLLVGAAPLFPLAVLLYCVPWRRVNVGWRRFKEVPYLKPFYVAFFWLLVSILPSLPAVPRPPTGAQLLAWGYVAARIATGVIASDIKDIRADSEARITTFSTRFGAIACVRGIQLAHLVLLVAVGIAASAAMLPKATLAIAVDGLGSLPLLERLRIPDATAGIVSDVFLEASMALMLPALLVTQFVMARAGY